MTMKTPETLLRLPVDSDLTARALVKAEELIEAEMGDLVSLNSPYLTLHVASQGFGTAMKLCFLLDYAINISTEFGHDAWKLTGWACKFVPGGSSYEERTVSVYSPGA